MKSSWVLLICWAVTLMCGCGDRDVQTCTPDSQRTCVCPGGGPGTQTCDKGGKSWHTCGGCGQSQDGGADARTDTSPPDLSPDKAPCSAGKTLCDKACVDLQQDSKNCGACAKKCKAGEVCEKGACAVSCQSGLTDCNGSCVNLKTDVNNCGGAAARARRARCATRDSVWSPARPG